ncbi:hypothetical protein B0H13DRAFT_1905438 [Mycena leptocephala]|nr:hypothetical protein B0H13DRAFT_1905438 [Mycena leptocephala]
MDAQLVLLQLPGIIYECKGSNTEFDLITKTHPALFPLHRWTNTEDFYGRSTTAPRERAPGSRNLGSAADVRCRNALHWRKIGSYVNTDEHRLGPGKGSRLWARRSWACLHEDQGALQTSGRFNWDGSGRIETSKWLSKSWKLYEYSRAKRNGQSTHLRHAKWLVSACRRARTGNIDEALPKPLRPSADEPQELHVLGDTRIRARETHGASVVSVPFPHPQPHYIRSAADWRRMRMAHLGRIPTAENITSSDRQLGRLNAGRRESLGDNPQRRKDRCIRRRRCTFCYLLHSIACRVPTGWCLEQGQTELQDTGERPRRCRKDACTVL